jgi:hypothetical protein
MRAILRQSLLFDPRAVGRSHGDGNSQSNGTNLTLSLGEFGCRPMHVIGLQPNSTECSYGLPGIQPTWSAFNMPAASKSIHGYTGQGRQFHTLWPIVLSEIHKKDMVKSLIFKSRLPDGNYGRVLDVHGVCGVIGLVMIFPFIWMQC